MAEESSEVVKEQSEAVAAADLKVTGEGKELKARDELPEDLPGK